MQIFYVYNALYGATLANCSHFQYVSRLRLRDIQIGVKACIGITLYDEPFSIIEKHILIPLRKYFSVMEVIKEFVVKNYVDTSFSTDSDDSKSQSRYILKVGAIS